jgi:hypothetical protein
MLMDCITDILTVNRKKEEPPLVLGRMFFEKVCPRSFSSSEWDPINLYFKNSFQKNF